jgi:hypothetical protein
MMYFGAKTVNNLPLLFEVAHPHNNNEKAIFITYKVPVLSLKPLFENLLMHIFSERN